ncbi:RES domain-containing protein [Flavobacterium sp. DG2-3]|uniref:RES domain-containing protein n=1 Tax=Flavobacterium sp. DG2-3 TaxID=3068317 RepID=UPI00273E00A9|nr:RES domain-containing protein [Flavobacterium sp. DG2-3]MDP5199016.1 RES domain-containing protein [Flavobacterium sp. DG2-3]
MRLNRDTQFFTSQDQLSYVTDPVVIRDHMTEFGRANKPHQPLFYGALESTRIKQNRITAYVETSSIILDTEAVLLEGELFTLSRWRTKEELLVPEVVFSDEAIKNNPDTAASFQKQYEFLKEEPLREIALRQLQLFSEEFARKKSSHHDYKISTAYADILMNEGGHPGILYPSVQSGYQGQNIVLKPDAVDDFLELTNVSTHRVHKNKMKSVMGNYYHTTDFGANNSSFVWNADECDEKALIEEYSKRASS